jgi:hypothetical protein
MRSSMCNPTHRASLGCSSWQSDRPIHGFYPNDRGQIWFTLAGEARRELLHRLLRLDAKLSARGFPKEHRARKEITDGTKSVL